MFPVVYTRLSHKHVGQRCDMARKSGRTWVSVIIIANQRYVISKLLSPLNSVLGPV